MLLVVKTDCSRYVWTAGKTRIILVLWRKITHWLSKIPPRSTKRETNNNLPHRITKHKIPKLRYNIRNNVHKQTINAYISQFYFTDKYYKHDDWNECRYIYILSGSALYSHMESIYMTASFYINIMSATCMRVEVLKTINHISQIM
jgi:hypothetical protein